LLQSKDIDEDKIKTYGMQLGENWDYGGGKKKQNGYFASSQVHFTLEKLERQLEVWLTLAEVAGISVKWTRYDHSNHIWYQDRAREDALEAAKNKAEALARSLNAEIGEPLFIEEDLSLHESYWGRNAYSNISLSAGESMAGDDTFAPGTIPIKMRVKAVFRLVNE